ncbi:hypothetical protein ACI77O_11960 [Pseudomonas tritici]|uniref:hypothetical protein n=1 Tax=Pseudomonas tritici TaxID=2745518 RepID=UPI00387B7741
MRYNLTKKQRALLRKQSVAAALHAVQGHFFGAGATKRNVSFAWETLTTMIIWLAVLSAYDIVIAWFDLLITDREGSLTTVAAKALHDMSLITGGLMATMIALGLRFYDIARPVMKLAEEKFVCDIEKRLP